MCHDEEPCPGSEQNTYVHKKVHVLDERLAFTVYKSSPPAYTFKIYREESNKLSKLMKKLGRKYEKRLALKAKTHPKLSFVQVRWNRPLKKNIIGFKDNEGETFFTPSAQAEMICFSRR